MTSLVVLTSAPLSLSLDVVVVLLWMNDNSNWLMRAHSAHRFLVPQQWKHLHRGKKMDKCFTSGLGSPKDLVVKHLPAPLAEAYLHWESSCSLDIFCCFATPSRKMSPQCPSGIPTHQPGQPGQHKHAHGRTHTHTHTPEWSLISLESLKHIKNSNKCGQYSDRYTKKRYLNSRDNTI